jgi:hypothetical protein
MVKYLSFHNSSFALRYFFNVNGKATMWHTPLFIQSTTIHKPLYSLTPGDDAILLAVARTTSSQQKAYQNWIDPEKKVFSARKVVLILKSKIVKSKEFFLHPRKDLPRVSFNPSCKNMSKPTRKKEITHQSLNFEHSLLTTWAEPFHKIHWMLVTTQFVDEPSPELIDLVSSW